MEQHGAGRLRRALESLGLHDTEGGARHRGPRAGGLRGPRGGQSPHACTRHRRAARSRTTWRGAGPPSCCTTSTSRPTPTAGRHPRQDRHPARRRGGDRPARPLFHRPADGRDHPLRAPSGDARPGPLLLPRSAAAHALPRPRRRHRDTALPQQHRELPCARAGARPAPRRPLRRAGRARSRWPRRGRWPDGGASAPFRLVVVGDADFASNSFFPYMSNGELALSALAWLLREERAPDHAAAGRGAPAGGADQSGGPRHLRRHRAGASRTRRDAGRRGLVVAAPVRRGRLDRRARRGGRCHPRARAATGSGPTRPASPASRPRA